MKRMELSMSSRITIALLSSLILAGCNGNGSTGNISDDRLTWAWEEAESEPSGDRLTWAWKETANPPPDDRRDRPRDGAESSPSDDRLDEPRERETVEGSDEVSEGIVPVPQLARQLFEDDQVVDESGFTEEAAREQHMQPTREISAGGGKDDGEEAERDWAYPDREGGYNTWAYPDDAAPEEDGGEEGERGSADSGEVEVDRAWAYSGSAAPDEEDGKGAERDWVYAGGGEG